MGFQTTAIPIQQAITIQEFEDFIFHPDNISRHFNFLAGEIIQKVSNSYSSIIGARILMRFGIHLSNNEMGHVLGANGGYQIGDDRYIPDVSYISYQRQPHPPKEPYISNNPNLVVEVMPPTDTDKALQIKVANYLAVGTLVWIVRPDDKVIEVYESGKSVTLLNEGDTLNGGMVLPKFSINIKDILPPQRDTLDADSISLSRSSRYLM